MKFKPVISIVLFFLSCSFLAAETTTRTYLEKDENKRITHVITWEVSPNGENIIIKTDKNNTQSQQVISGDIHGQTLSWTYESEQERSNITAVRTGKTIRMTGTRWGKKVDKSFDLDDYPWNQPFQLGVERFVRQDGGKSFKFWTIGTTGPGDMKIARFEASKKRTEDIVINGKIEKTLCYKITFTSFIYSMFWHGYYWYRVSDGFFLRYKGKSASSSSEYVQ